MKLLDCLITFGLVACAACITTHVTASAQQITGTPGSPGGTTTISGNQLPAPDPKFGGVIKDGALQSTAWWAPRVVPPKGAPNVLLIMTDDSGFGVPSTFGGVIPTPTTRSNHRFGCEPRGPRPSRCGPRLHHRTNKPQR